MHSKKSGRNFMKISRRKFFGSTIGAAIGGSVLSSKSQASVPTLPVENKLQDTVKTTTICPFCAVGCGMTVYQKSGKIVNIEGDPDHPINEGALCSKGNAMLQVANSERRLSKVLYRASGSTEWEEKTWNWAISEIADRIKKIRDATFVKKEEKKIVNRTEGIASLGGAALDNEECYLLSKFMRSLGIVYLEHQARI